MKVIRDFLIKYLPQLLLSSYLIKVQIIGNDSSNIDIVSIAMLTLLSGYRMYLNSVFDKKVGVMVEDALESAKRYSEELSRSSVDARTEIRKMVSELEGIVIVNHKEVDEALANITTATNEEMVKLKDDMGQINLSQGIGNGKKQQIFF